MSEPRVSILVCTRNRSELLRDCLETVLADRSAVSRELVVVDNGPSDDTEAVVRDLASRSPLPLRYVVEPRVGIAHARNAAVRAARGELLLFADDDVLACNGWTDALVAGFDDPGVAVVVGRVLPRWPFAPPAWLDGPHMEMLSLVDHGDDARPLRSDEYGVSANLGLRGAVLREFDPPFNFRLGHADGLRIAHEEAHLIDRMRALGSVVYRPDAVVHHRIAAERIDLEWLRASFFQQGVGKGRRHRIDREPLPSLARRAVRAVRALRDVRAARRRNAGRAPSGPETWSELLALAWAGFHLELLVGRSDRLSDSLVRHRV